MLGVKSTREPIRGEFAQRFIEQLYRISAGELNDQDKAIEKFQSATPYYNIIAD